MKLWQLCFRGWAHLPCSVATSFFALYFPVFYLQLDAELHGVDKDLAFYLLTIYNAVSIPGRLLPNYIADKVGIFNTIITCMAACAGIIVGMLGIKRDENARVAVIVIAAVYGFFSGAVISLLTPLAPSISRGPHEIGIRLGVIFLFIGPCGLLSGPVAGWLLGDRSRPLQWEWERPIWFSAVRSSVAFYGDADYNSIYLFLGYDSG